MTIDKPSVRVLASVLVCMALALAGCTGDDNSQNETNSTATVVEAAGQVSVDDAWSRLPAPGQTSAAVYATLSNNTVEDRVLLTVTTPMTDRAELHQTVIDSGGIARMQAQTGGVAIAAGETVNFQPSGAHIMLRDVKEADFSDSVDLVLTFDDGSEVSVSAVLLSIGETINDRDGASGS